MSAVAFTRPAPFGAIALFRAVTAIESAVKALRASWASAEARRALSRLTPHGLADIGLADATLTRLDLAALDRALATR
jgi:uncharacterized protein YjiS (DUF1127 family)